MSRVEFNSKIYSCWENEELAFRLTQPLGVKWFNDEGNLIVEFIVPAGFLTDLASIPRWATPIIPKLGHHLRAAVAHDWLYEHDEGLKRIQCDDLFFDGMKLDGVSRSRRNIMYQAVRIGGENLFGPGVQEPTFEEFDDE